MMTKLPLKLRKLHDGTYTALIARGSLGISSNGNLYIATYVDGFCLVEICPLWTNTLGSYLKIQELETLMKTFAPINEWKGI